MKGVVFREFMAYAEARLGEEALDEILEAPGLSTGGAYTAVGTYPAADMGILVGGAAAKAGCPVSRIVGEFGEHCGAAFLRQFPHYHAEAADLFDFLESVDGKIHIEVRTLYPDAELPRFRTLARTQDRLTLEYRSSRRLHLLAVGIIRSLSRHYGEPVEVEVREEGEGDAWRAILDVRRTG